LKYLKKLHLPKGDYAVFGSGPLFVRGIIPNISDLDVICRGAAWETVKKVGALQYCDVYDVAIITINNEQVTFGNSWGTGNFDVGDLIDGAEFIDEIPFVQLRHVVEYKMRRASAKDLQHIELFKKSEYFSLLGAAN
jgi:hypothetical protein